MSRSIVSIHQKGFVTNVDGSCFVRLFNATTGTSEVTRSSGCSFDSAVLNARSGGIGEPYPPLSVLKNGIIPLCVLSSFDDMAVNSLVPAALSKMPRDMYAEIPIYGATVWRVTHIPGVIGWKAMPTTLTRSQALAQSGCVAFIPPGTTPAPSPTPSPTPSPSPTSNFPVPIADTSIDWRIALIVAIAIALVVYISYEYTKSKK